MEIIGYVDKAQNEKVIGWIAQKINENTYMRSTACMYIDDVLIEEVVASKFRQDLYDHGIRPGNFGFEIILGPSFKQTKYAAVRIVNIDGAELLGLKLRLVNGQFYHATASVRSGSSFDLFGVRSLSDIEKQAAEVAQRYGDVELLHYLYGVLLNRSPERHAILDIESYSIGAKQLMRRIIASDEYKSRN